MPATSSRVLLIDPADGSRSTLAQRLRSQGFLVDECADGAEGAVQALEQPPAVVVADLQMPSISGVQLCRLLRSETGTAQVPVILRGPDERRNRFWAEQAGATAYVVKGGMGDLVRALRRAVEREVDDESEFFIVGSTDGLDVKERIATHLDAALFESVIAAEVRRLGTCESFDRLVDLLSQFASQVSKYRWLALMRHTPGRLGIHSNPAAVESSLAEARRALGASADLPTCSVVDEDAFTSVSGSTPVVFPIHFSDTELGRLALAPCVGVHADDTRLARTIAYELGGALRMASLVEESQLMATTDPLTGLLNRRAFMHAAGRELARAARYEDSLSAILLDVDHFKRINDDRGHAAGDLVLSKVGRLLAGTVRSCDIVARWGGEEFVIALPSTPPDGAALLAERLRVLLQEHEILDAQATPIPVTASFGVAGLVTGDSLDQLIDRADRAMYAAKTNGRNRIHLMQCVRDSALQLSQTAE